MAFMERAAAGSLPLWEAAANTRFLPLVDKGIHGFHGPCPHRTSLRALFSDPVYSRCARIHGDPHALLRGVLGVPTNSSARNWWGELRARVSFY